MARSRIQNLTGYPVPLPMPFRGILAGGAGTVVSGTKSVVRSLLGGDAVAGVLGIDTVPDTVPVGPHDVQDFGGRKLTDVSDPSAAQDVATKAYADARQAAAQAYAAALVAGLVVFQKTVATITQTNDLAKLAPAAKTFAKIFGNGQFTFPSGARFAGYNIVRTAQFDDATHGTFGAELGSLAGANTIMQSLSVDANTGTGPAQGTPSMYPGFDLSGVKPSLNLTSSVDLNTATGGALTAEILYYVLP